MAWMQVKARLAALLRGGLAIILLALAPFAPLVTATPALAAPSAACSALNGEFGVQQTYTNVVGTLWPPHEYYEFFNFNIGETITWTASGSGTQNTWGISDNGDFSPQIDTGNSSSWSTSGNITLTGSNAGYIGVRIYAQGASSVTLQINCSDGAPVKTDQTITFNNPGTLIYGTNPVLTASASSDLPIAWSSTTPGVCSIDGSSGTLSFPSTGTCTINANQAGDSSFNPAPQVQQSFAVNAPAPSITGQPSNASVAVGGNTSFSVAASNATSYQWQVDQGAGFTELVNGGVYSGATSATLIITGATLGMNNYRYRVAVSGVTAPHAASNSATLTVFPLPVVSSVSGPTSDVYCIGENLDFTVYFDQNVSVTGTPTLGLTLGATPVSASYVSGNGTNALTFRYTVQNGDPDHSAVAVGALSLNGGTIMGGGLPANLTLNNVSSMAGVAVDGTPPSVASIALNGTPDVSAVSISFAVTFSEPVSNVGIGNFSLHATGTASASVAAVSQESSNRFIVTVAPISGEGTLRLDLSDTTGIRDLPGNDMAAPFTSGDSHMVLPVPIVGAVPLNVAANSVDNPVGLDISGGSVDTVAIDSPASHGTAIANGMDITYTPTPGYSGQDSFTYVAINGAGYSAPALVTVTVTPPTLLLAPASLPDGRQGSAYEEVLAASEGTAPYGFAITGGALPAGLNLSPEGVLSGTPTGHGAFSFTVTANDAYGALGAHVYDLEIERQPVTLAFDPAGGALPKAMAGEDYSAAIATTNGTAPVLYSVISGTMPAGMVLNVSTGALTGPLDADTEGHYSFTIQAKDANDDTGTASYTLEVTERAIGVTDKEVNVPPGATPTNVSLEAGATGGPFVSADIVAVEPPNGGKAQIVMGEFAQSGGGGPVSFYLKFTPNPSFTGRVVVRFTLASSLGTSNPGIVAYNLGYDPVATAQNIEKMTRGFVQARQSLVAANIKLPGLRERRLMAAGSDPVTGRLSPSSSGLVFNFATSLVQMNAAANAAAGLADNVETPFNIWIDGTLSLHNRPENNNRWGSFGMVSAGADYLVSDKALIGLSFHYDHMSDPSDADSLLTGNGWLAGPYASFELGEGVFWDSSLLYGGSANIIDTDLWDGTFDTQRWLLDTAIMGQWRLDEATVLTPKLRAVYVNESVAAYTVENGAGDQIVMDGFTSEQLRVSLGAEIAHTITLEDGSALTPKLGINGGFAGLDGSGGFGALSTGFSWKSPDALSIDGNILLNIEGSGQTSIGARLGLSGQF